MTIRGLDDLTIKALKEKAKKEGSSVNAALVKLLQEDLGIKKKKRTVVYNDLDHLAGTWSDKDYKEFLQATRLSFEPLLPADWEGFRVHYRYRETVYHIAVLRRQVGDDAASVTVDGAPQRDKTIPLVDDHREHAVEVRIPTVEID